MQGGQTGLNILSLPPGQGQCSNPGPTNGFAVSMIDIECRRLPTPIVYGTGLAAGLLLVPAAGELGAWGGLGRAGVGAAATFGGFLALAMIFPKGLGFGDVRLAGLCGGILGWVGYRDIIVGLLIASGIGTIAGLITLWRRNGVTSIPFGPYLAVGTLAAVVIGPSFLL
jgi:leader peptidase (prepilin peptidase)/N-methyltransferase